MKHDFTDYKQCVKNSSCGKVNVKSMTISDFRDWLDKSSMQKINELTPIPYLADIVWRRTKRDKYTFDYKTEFDQPSAITCNLLTLKTCKTGIPDGTTQTTIIIQHLYSALKSCKGYGGAAQRHSSS